MRCYLSINKIIIRLSVLLFLAGIVLIACSQKSTEIQKPVALNGVLDLGSWDLVRDGSVKLDGEWEFYWDHLYDQSDFADKAKLKGCGFITVPGLWKGRIVNGIVLPGKGHATYRLKIISAQDKRQKTLTIRRVLSAYKLWVNGILLDEKGIPGRSLKKRDDYIYIYTSHNVSFILNEGVNEIVVQVLNQDYENGGIDPSLRLDDGETLTRKEFYLHTIDMIIVGLLLFASIYNILFYFSHKKYLTPLYIGFASLLCAINTYNIQHPILTGSLFYARNPFLVNYITAILTMILFIVIVKSLFPADFSKIVIILFQIIAAAVLVVVCIVEFRISKQIMNALYIFSGFFVIYSIYVLVKAIMKQSEDAVFFFTAYISLYIAYGNNVLNSLWIINTGNALQYGLVIFCFSTTLVVSRRFARAMRKVEEMSMELEAKNISLKKMDRIKDQFLACTSHELRTPLHGMIGLSESMIEGAAGSLPPKALENLTLIASSGHRLAGMVNDLLDMAKIQDEGLTLNLRPVDLYALSEMVVKLSLPLAGGKPLEIINSIRPDIPAVHADEERIRQVLHNLVGNAVKFTNKGTVEISARVISPEDGGNDTDNSRMIEVSVSDTGIGIPDEYKKIIFEVYRQLDWGDTRLYSGSGLGLSIARQIIQLHNGTITAFTGKNGGSVFVFTLPVSSDPVTENRDEIAYDKMESLTAADPSECTVHPAGINGNLFEGNPVFLVVDDDPVNVKVLRNYLEAKNCVVKTAPDGLSAIDIIEHDGTIDLVLLDIMMPVMSGYEVCRRIRLTRTPEDLPVIMLTAKNMISDIDAAFEAGANDYLVKPFRISELLVRVSTMLKLRNVRKSVSESIIIRDKYSAYSFKFSEIIHITSHAKNIVIHTVESDIELSIQMKDLADRLPRDLFIRIHKSHIINLQFVHSLSHVLSGRYRVRLKDADDTELPVGSAFLESLRKKI